MAPSECYQALLERGVIVRDVGGAIRISVGTDEENERLLSALDEVLA
jgi:histidinol-phosphate/aromatic aminotransferase/cobyric acid decarboxylase-like protein